MEEKIIHDLIDRFFEGRTTNEEEQRLYEYFSKNEVPDSLESYRQLFDFFGKQKIENEQLQVVRKSSEKHRFYYGIAASIAALLCIGVFFQKLPAKTDNPYEGSYIIRNGKKITDPQVIRPELEKTMYLVAMQEEMSARLIEKIDEEEFSIE